MSHVWFPHQGPQCFSSPTKKFYGAKQSAHIHINRFCCCCSWKDVIKIILPFRGGAKFVHPMGLSSGVLDSVFDITGFFSRSSCLLICKHSVLPRALLVTLLQGVSLRKYVSSFKVLLAVFGSGVDSPYTRKHNRFLGGSDLFSLPSQPGHFTI